MIEKKASIVIFQLRNKFRTYLSTGSLFSLIVLQVFNFGNAILSRFSITLESTFLF